MKRTILFCFGIIYFWFGALKFFTGLSPAEALAGETVHLITFDLLSMKAGLTILATMECFIGLFLILNIYTTFTIRIMIGHLVCTFLPIVLLPEEVFVSFPFQLTLTGQYILKNLVLLTVAVLIMQTSPEKKVKKKRVGKKKPALSPALAPLQKMGAFLNSFL